MQNNFLLTSRSVKCDDADKQFEQTVRQLRSTRLLLADGGQIRPQPDYATAIHFLTTVCYMIDLSI